MRYARILTSVFISSLLTAGCVTLPRQNKAIKGYDPHAGYRYANLAPGTGNSDSLLVVLTFSGGGTRAAAFSYGVLEKLRDTRIEWEGQSRRLLDEVDIISSVSGGSLTSAYYASFGDRIFDEFPKKVLYPNLQGNILRRMLAIQNYPKLFSPFYGRTDLMADTFTSHIFDHKTFGDLLSAGHRPYLIVNATDIARGTRFEFTQNQFDLLYSDLRSYPVGHAVAASAAFPGLLTPMTVRNFEQKEDYRTPDWVLDEVARNNPDSPRYKAALEQLSYIESGRPYIHLSDGGVSDNLGLLPVIEFLNGSVPSTQIRTALDNGTIKKVVIITVNAKRVVKLSWNVKGRVLNMAKVLGAVSVAPMVNFSEGETTFLRTYIRQLQERKRIWQRLALALGEKRAAAYFPGLAGAHPDFRFIEVEFNRLGDEAAREYLNDIPTAFNLKREQVDKLREAAGRILDGHPEFQGLLSELNPTE